MRAFFALSFFCLNAIAQNVAVLTHQAANSERFQAGFPGGWPYSSPVDIGDSTNVPPQLGANLVVMSKAELEDQMTLLAPEVEAWNKAQEVKQDAPRKVAQELERRLYQRDFSNLEIDALQSEFVGLLLHAYLQNTELLLLVTKAVGASALTNNLTAQERTRVSALRPQIAFPRQPDFTSDDRARAVAIRDNVLIPHYQLYKAAKEMLARISTNAIPEDPTTSTNWPAATIGE